MLIFTLRRLNLFLITLLVLSILAFSLSFLFPGDSLINRTGEVNASAERIEYLAEKHHINDSIVKQYISYLQSIFSGDLGVSMTSHMPISQDILTLLPATVELSLVALFIVMTLGIPIGFLAAIKHNKNTDRIILSLSMIGYSIPVFWLGLFAILIFSIQLGWLPAAGQLGLIYEIEHKTGILLFDILLSNSSYKWQAFIDATLHIIMPAFVIALAPATVFVRLARTAVLEVLGTPYTVSYTHLTLPTKA